MQKYKVWFAQSAQAVTAVLCVHGQVLARGRESWNACYSTEIRVTYGGERADTYKLI